jgi:hypothetical protein
MKNNQEMVAKMEARIEDNSEKSEVLQGALLSQIDAWIAEIRDGRKETVA